MYIDAKRLLEVLRLAISAAYHACEHSDHESGAKHGCGACRAVVELEALRDETIKGLGDAERPLLAVMEERESRYAEDEHSEPGSR